MKKAVLPVILSAIWISLSEVFRNSFLLHHYWIEHYGKLGQNFPESPANGMVWGLWALIFASVIFILSKKFTFWQTVLIGWITGFVMMWLVIGNLGVLPFSILPVAIPLSFLEVFIAQLIINYFNRKK